MNSAIEALAIEYRQGLHAYLRQKTESQLHRAYELGRRGNIDGVGCVDIAKIHHEALIAEVLDAQNGKEIGWLAQQGSDFLAESLSSFEMTHRGYREAILHLSQQAIELAALNRQLHDEIEDRKKAQAALVRESSIVELLSALTGIVNMAPDVDSAYRSCIETICRWLGWPLGHLSPVEVNPGHAGVSAGSWHIRGAEPEETAWGSISEPVPEVVSVLRTEVIASKKPVWMTGIDGHGPMTGAGLLNGIRIKTGAGFPVMIGGNVVAVLEFFTDREGEPESRLLGMMEQTGVQLGRAVDRQRLEDFRRAIPRMILDAQESERKRVAHDLHDELCQQLSALKMQVQVIEDGLGSPKKSIRPKFNAMRRLIDLNIQSVRQLSTSLRPSTLDDLGLVPALELLCAGIRASHRIRVMFLSGVPATSRFDSQIETSIFRIVQEALTNASKHAGADSITLELASGASGLVCAVTDDGHGFDTAILTQPHPVEKMIGTISMKERAELVGGVFEIHSAPGHGTRVQVSIPIPVGKIDA